MIECTVWHRCPLQDPSTLRPCLTVCVQWITKLDTESKKQKAVALSNVQTVKKSTKSVLGIFFWIPRKSLHKWTSELVENKTALHLAVAAMTCCASVAAELVLIRKNLSDYYCVQKNTEQPTDATDSHGLNMWKCSVWCRLIKTMFLTHMVVVCLVNLWECGWCTCNIGLCGSHYHNCYKLKMAFIDVVCFVVFIT